VAVILGCEAGRCAKPVENLPVVIRINDRWPEGMSTSLHCAVDFAAERGAGAVLVLACDQYRLMPDDLAALNDVWQRSPASACVSRGEGYIGPPVMLPHAYFEQLRRLRGDTGARAVLHDGRWPPPIEVATWRAAYDLDLPSDVIAAQSFREEVAIRRS
jgi:molybdenum cofactor cytidylyltransferase